MLYPYSFVSLEGLKNKQYIGLDVFDTAVDCCTTYLLSTFSPFIANQIFFNQRNCNNSVGKKFDKVAEMAEIDNLNNGQRENGGGDEGDAWGSNDSSVSVRRYAKMPVDRNAPFYNMNHKSRGMALIFNHEHFDIHSLKSRTGTNVDCDNLAKVLKSLGFVVTILNNLKCESINKYIQETADIDHTNNDCLLIAVLTHGEMGLLYAKDTHYKPDNLWSYFTADKCPSLAGKPKLFFIQACQGDKLDGGIILDNSGRTETDGSSNASYRIPIHADFLIVFSTVPGFYSWRNTTRGSWFMQALCEELRYAGTERDILTLLTFVCQKVALDFESNTPDVPCMHQQKQVPCITSMLTRLLVFNKK